LANKPKVLVLFDVGEPTSLDDDYTEDLRSPDWKTERHVLHALKMLGHPVAVLGVHNDTGLIREMIARFQPDIIFNMIEEFANSLDNESRITSFLELQGIPLTGCGSAGISLSKDKPIAKKILSYHGIRVPRFVVQPPGRLIKMPRDLEYPLIVKPAHEEASQGISLRSVVKNPTELINRICHVHERFQQDAIVEEFVEGRELYASLLGNKKISCFPAREMTWRKDVPAQARFAGYKVKWDNQYRRRWGIRNRHLPDSENSLQRKIDSTCKEIYRRLNLKGYARLDLRATPSGDLVFLEANPNPMLAKDEDFALSAKKSGLDYPKLIGKIISLAS
tara:strand:+ start:437 stop:1441 length:1005 start_codon:yes stop_codon:yes gene_type:complete